MSKKHYEKNSDDDREKSTWFCRGTFGKNGMSGVHNEAISKLNCYSGAKIVMIRLLRITDTLWLNYFNFGSNFY